MAESKPTLKQMTLRQLRKIAIKLDLPQFCRMRKQQLFSVITKLLNNPTSDNPSPVDESKVETSNESLTNTENTTDQEKQTANLSISNNNTVDENSSKTQDTSAVNDQSSDIFADIDDDNDELPQTYGEKKIVLMPCDSQWAYVYWDIPAEDKATLRSQGGTNLSLRLYDVTDIEDSNPRKSQNTLEYICNESATNWYIPIPLSDRDYIVEIGYRCVNGKWLSLACSQSVSMPTLSASNWREDTFVSVSWDQALDGSSLYSVASENDTSLKTTPVSMSMPSFDSQTRVDASIYRQVNQTPDSVNSIGRVEFASGSGMGMMSGSGMGMMSGSGMGMMSGSGMGMMSGSGMGIMSGSGMGMMSGSGMGMMSGSGMGMMSGSGMGMMSGSGMGLTRNFWLMANAHLTVYGATVPNAKLTIANQAVKLNPDGTFTFQIAFPDGLIDCPIVAVSADQVETRSIQIKFDRQTSYSEKQVQEASENLIEQEPPTSIKEVIDKSVSFSANEPDIHDLSIHQDNNSDSSSEQGEQKKNKPTAEKRESTDTKDSTGKEESTDTEDSTKKEPKWFPVIDQDDTSDWFPPIN